MMTEKEFFDWMRRNHPNKRLTQEMVDASKKMFECNSIEFIKESLEKINNWREPERFELSDSGFYLIGQFESFRSEPYIDMVGVPTIGYGNTYYPDGRKVTMQDKPISKAEATALKRAIVNKDFAPAVRRAIEPAIKRGDVTQNMFDACVSLAYNIGVAGFAGSSVARHLNAGNIEKAANSFLLWNKGRVNGVRQVINGLTRRRQMERGLFLSK